MEGLYTTGEFAKLCGVSKDTLFLYDELGVLKPTIVKKNGYRYYSIRQLFLFNQIISLNESGIPLQEIQALFDDRERDDYLDALRNALHHLRKKEKHLSQSIEFLEKTIGAISSVSAFLEGEGDTAFSDMALEHFSDRMFSHCSEPFDLQDPSEFTRRMNEAIQAMRTDERSANVNLCFTMDQNGFLEERFDKIAFCGSCEKGSDGSFVQPSGIYLTLTYLGNYIQLNSAFQRLHDYMESMGYAMHGNLIGEFQFLHRNKAQRQAIPLAASKRTDITDDERRLMEQNERFEVALDIIMRIAIRVSLK